MITQLHKLSPLKDQIRQSPSNRSHATPTEAVRELIRRAMEGKIEPEDYFRAVQLIREYGDFDLGSLFRAINQIEKIEESEKEKTFLGDKEAK